MKLFLIFAAITGMTTAAPALEPSLPLAGAWCFQLDRADAGIREQWFQRTLPDTVKLPGTLAAQGIGDDVDLNTPWTGWLQDKEWFKKERYAPYAKADNFKFPFWLQPEKYYAGAAWFQRDVDIPTNWIGRRVVLFLERAHWETRVWVDGRCIGTNNSLSTPHEYELGVVARAFRPSDSTILEHTGETPVPLELTPGKHTISIRVDNRRIVDIGQNSHAISDHTQGNWNGIVGKIELFSTRLVWLEDLQIYPQPGSQTAIARGRLRNETGYPVTNSVRFCYSDKSSDRMRYQRTNVVVTGQSKDSAFQQELRWAGIPPTWDEFSPQISGVWAWPVTSERESGGSEPLGLYLRTDVSSVIGVRDVSTSGTQFTINGQKTFIRGTLECAIFPKTGHPPMEVEEWRRIIRVAKSYGLNLLRFHSWCPPEAAFQAADELGMYFQIETCWPDSPALGEGKPVDQWIYDETDRILKYYGNHPSFILMSHGNEPGGKQASAFLAKYVAHYRAKDPRRLWTSGSGWPEIAENQFHVTPKPRIQQWGEGLKSRINAKPPETMTDYREFISQRTVPVISHEIGQWCVYPNFDEIPKYTGYLKPKNFEIFRDLAEKNGLFGRAGSPLPAAGTHTNDGAHGVTRPTAKDFLFASGKLQTLCYKEDIESALRTPGMGGFQLLDLHDFPGQGTALVGVLDPFWVDKGYVTAGEYSRFCNSTVPLARLKKRVFTTDETLEAEIEVAHFGPLPILGDTKSSAPDFGPVVSEWKLAKTDGAVVACGQFTNSSISVGNTNYLGRVAVSNSKLAVPACYKLSVAVRGQMWTNGFVSRTVRVENDWDIWVYPAQPKTEPAKDILVTTQFDDTAQKHLASGGKLLLTLPADQVRNYDVEPVKLGFSSIFWNTAWTKRQAPTTLGILCDPKHPALADFPTDFHSNWQWWYLIHRAGALRLDLLPAKTEPVVRVIDDWVTARPLGLVVEGKSGKGKLIVCGFDLTDAALTDPVSRQMRASLLKYLDSDKCQPASEFSADQIASLIRQPGSSK